jgi:hypothetical protein
LVRFSDRNIGGLSANDQAPTANSLGLEKLQSPWLGTANHRSGTPKNMSVGIDICSFDTVLSSSSTTSISTQ